jgi:transcription elongation GreA/GreB family factor
MENTKCYNPEEAKEIYRSYKKKKEKLKLIKRQRDKLIEEKLKLMEELDEKKKKASYIYEDRGREIREMG